MFFHVIFELRLLKIMLILIQRGCEVTENLDCASVGTGEEVAKQTKMIRESGGNDILFTLLIKEECIEIIASVYGQEKFLHVSRGEILFRSVHGKLMLFPNPHSLSWYPCFVMGTGYFI